MKVRWTAVAALFVVLGLTACGESDAQREEAASFTPKPHHDQGGGSDRFIVKGGDNTVQEFGREAGASERRAAASALHDFFDARAEGNWAAACAQVADPVAKSLVKLVAQADHAKDVSCVTVLGKLTNPAAKSELTKEAAKTDIGPLRVEGEHSFLIYSVFGKTILAIPMAREQGEWKVAGLDGVPLE